MRIIIDEKERLLTVLNGKKPDRVPCICPGGMMNMVVTELMEKVGIMWPDAHTDAKKMAELSVAVYENKCFENYGVPFCMTIEVEKMGAKVDLGSTICEPHVISYPIDTVSDYKKLSKMNIHGGRSQIVLDALSILKKREDGIPIVGNLTGPVSVASSLIEPVIFYKELRKNNKDTHEYINFVTEQLILFGNSQIEAGADVITISDPSGTGEILGPQYFDEFVVKYMNKLIDGLQTAHKNVPIIVHICGQMHSVYKQLNKINGNAFSFDAVVSISEAKKQLPEKLVMGNVSSFALEFSNIEKIRIMTQKVIDDGSDIISPACGLGTQSPLSNIQAILSTVKGNV